MPVVGLLLFAGIWQAVTIVLALPDWLLPPPTAVLDRIVDQWSLLLDNALVTVLEVLVGYGVAAAAGVGVAVLLSATPVLERTIMPMLVATNSVPKISVAPLLLLWFGTGPISKVTLVALIAFFPIVINTVTGFQSVDRDLVQVFRSVGASSRDVFLKLRLPYAVPYIIAGLKVATTLSVIGAIVAEWVSASKGLGYLILSGITNFETELVFASIVVLVIIGVGFFDLISMVGRKLSWQPEADTQTMSGA